MLLNNFQLQATSLSIYTSVIINLSFSHSFLIQPVAALGQGKCFYITLIRVIYFYFLCLSKTFSKLMVSRKLTYCTNLAMLAGAGSFKLKVSLCYAVQVLTVTKWFQIPCSTKRNIKLHHK